MNRRPTDGAGDRSAAREAFLLPVLFLTVTLIGGLRVGLVGGQLDFRSPPLISLVLGILLVGVLIQGGVLAPERLMSERRAPLENLSGAILLVVLFAGSAQLFNAMTPETGLLHLFVNVFFVVLLWNTMAARPDRMRLLRSLLVVFGSAFALRYIVLAALYDPGGGLAKRVLTTLMEGATLGTLGYETWAPATGYLAFLAVYST